MDKLEKSKQGELRKLTDARLVAKLTQAGIPIDEVEALDRNSMLDKWAEIIIAGKDVAIKTGVATSSASGYDVELERQKLKFQMKQWEDERAERQAQREADKLEREAQRELEMRRLVDEKESRDALLLLQQRQVILMEKKESEENAKENQTLQLLKKYGDALRNSIVKLSNDLIEIIPFFENFERQMSELKVPVGIRVSLLKPFLNDRARLLVNRIESKHANDYDYVKEYLLQQFKLVPQYFLESFNSLHRQSQETYRAFISRLSMLLDYYLSSRKITTLDELKQLLVSDRVKVSLTEGPLSHLLRVEATLAKKYATPDEAAEILDTYCSNYDARDHPRASALGMATRRMVNHKPDHMTVGLSSTAPSVHPSKGNFSIKPSTSVKLESVKTVSGKSCFKCNSVDHLIKDCPQRTGTRPQFHGSFNGQKPGQSTLARVNACSTTVCTTEVGMGVLPNVAPPISAECDIDHGQVDEVGITSLEGVSCNACTTDIVSRHCMPVETFTRSLEPMDNVNISNCGSSKLGIDLAPLNFINVRVQGHNECVRSLVDSGSEINVLRSDVLLQSPIEPIGEVTFKGIIGSPITAPLICLRVQISDDVMSDDDYIPVIFAVCSEVNETCILSIPTVNQLTDKLNRNIIRASVNVVTRSQAKAQPLPSIITESIDNEIMSKDTNTDGTMLNRNNTDIDNDIFIDVDVVKLPDIESESAITNAREFASEQQRDETLSCAWKLARRDKSGYVIKDELLYHTEKRCGQIFDALCVPHSRRLGIMNLAHNNSHFGIRHTKERIISSGLWWPTIAADTQKWVTECNECQLRARKTWKDRVPIHGTIRDTDVWHYFYMDCAGPIVPNANLRYNYVLVLIDSCSRYPFAYPLRTLSAKNVCNALMCMFQTTGIPIGMTIASDNGSNFRAALTRELMSCLGVSPVFSTPYHPVSVVERSIQTLKNTIAKMAYDHKDSWVNYLGPSLWAIRSTVNETVGCPPHLLVFGHMPRGPLSILNDTWTGKADIPANVSRSTVEYLDDLRSRLETAQNYATLCAEHEQLRHVTHYNLKAQDKSFSVGDSCLILQPESTSSHALRRWKGPAKIIRIMSPYSYMVDYNGTQYRMHANNLRKFNTRVCEIKCESISVFMQCESNDDVESMNLTENVVSCNCAVVYDHDVDFGELVVIDPPSFKNITERLPSQKITPE